MRSARRLQTECAQGCQRELQVTLRFQLAGAHRQVVGILHEVCEERHLAPFIGTAKHCLVSVGAQRSLHGRYALLLLARLFVESAQLGVILHPGILCCQLCCAGLCTCLTHLSLILPQGESYSINVNKTGHYPLINFTCAEKFCDSFLSFTLDSSEECISDYNMISNLMLFEGNRAKIISLFYNIIHNINSYKNVNTILTPAIKYINDNFSNSTLTNTVLAEKCKISEVYFRKLFISQYKISPKQFILKLRLSKAKQLLGEGAYKISAVAQMCGFSSVCHFSREFKLKEGISPGEYMKKNRIYKI